MAMPHPNRAWTSKRIHQALERLATHDERKARLVELRFFAGLSLEDAADVLGLARSTASEDWRMARAWLHRELRKDATLTCPSGSPRLMKRSGRRLRVEPASRAAFVERHWRR